MIDNRETRRQISVAIIIFFNPLSVLYVSVDFIPAPRMSMPNIRRKSQTTVINMLQSKIFFLADA